MRHVQWKPNGDYKGEESSLGTSGERPDRIRHETQKRTSRKGIGQFERKPIVAQAQENIIKA